MNKYISIIVIYILFLYFNKAYFRFYPTIPIYPNNNIELNDVKEYISSRNHKDVSFFYLTNESVSNAFMPYVNESEESLSRIITSQNKPTMS